MGKAALHHDPPSVLGQLPSPEDIRLQLQAILESPAFQGSNRSRQFLAYVCEKSLAGDVGALKEKTIAVEVFGRSPESSLGEDTIVRVGAREVRKRLAQFYVLPDGAASKVRIDLPSGSYAPEFRYVTPEKEKEPAPVAEVAAPPSPPPVVEPAKAAPRWTPRALLIPGIIIVAIAAVVLLTRQNAPDANAVAFSRFWQPVLRSSDPLLLAVGHPIVYHPSARAVKLSEDRLPPMPIPGQRPLQLAPNELTGADIVPVLNQYVGFGDMVVSTQVAAMLAKQSKDVRVRMANSVQFADLRQSQALLVGAFTNRWTMELGQSWRFQFARTSEPSTMIVDTFDKNPKPGAARREWRTTPRDDGSVAVDYILVSRIPRSTTGGLLIVAAGVKQFGTEAAGRLLTDPHQLGGILRKLPQGWEEKNLQVVLQTKVIGNTPAEPELVAWHVW